MRCWISSRLRISRCVLSCEGVGIRLVATCCLGWGVQVRWSDVPCVLRQ